MTRFFVGALAWVTMITICSCGGSEKKVIRGVGDYVMQDGLARLGGWLGNPRKAGLKDATGTLYPVDTWDVFIYKTTADGNFVGGREITIPSATVAGENKGDLTCVVNGSYGPPQDVPGFDPKIRQAQVYTISQDTTCPQNVPGSATTRITHVTERDASGNPTRIWSWQVVNDPTENVPTPFWSGGTAFDQFLCWPKSGDTDPRCVDSACSLTDTNGQPYPGYTLCTLMTLPTPL